MLSPTAGGLCGKASSGVNNTGSVVDLELC